MYRGVTELQNRATRYIPFRMAYTTNTQTHIQTYTCTDVDRYLKERTDVDGLLNFCYVVMILVIVVVGVDYFLFSVGQLSRCSNTILI